MDEEWALIEPLISLGQAGGGNKRIVEVREIVVGAGGLDAGEPSRVQGGLDPNPSRAMSSLASAMSVALSRTVWLGVAILLAVVLLRS